MKVIKPNTVSTPDGSFARASSGTYFDSTGTMQTASTNVPRFNYNPLTTQYEGLLIEPSSTNILLNSNTLSTQTVTVNSITNYTLSFYGTGTIVLSGATSATVIGTGVYPNRKTYSFTSSSTSLTLTVTGTVQYAQLESLAKASTYISTLGSSVTRAADVITGSNLIYTDLTDSTATYSSGTTYSVGNKVIYNGNIYESLQNTNLAHQPDIYPTWWLYDSPDNRHAAFDTQVSTASTATTSMTFVVKAGKIDSVALINIGAVIIEIAVTDQTSGTLIYNSSAGLSGVTVTDWYQYFFFDPTIKRTQLVFQNIPNTYANAIVSVKLTGGTGDIVSIGQALYGNSTYLGGTQYGAKAGIVDYSKKDTDIFGTTTFVKRAFTKTITCDVLMENYLLNTLQNFLYGIRATPVVWIASDDPQYQEPLIVYGYYKDFSTAITYPAQSMCSLTIEGLS